MIWVALLIAVSTVGCIESAPSSANNTAENNVNSVNADPGDAGPDAVNDEGTIEPEDLSCSITGSGWIREKFQVTFNRPAAIMEDDLILTTGDSPLAFQTSEVHPLGFELQVTEDVTVLPAEMKLTVLSADGDSATCVFELEPWVSEVVPSPDGLQVFDVQFDADRPNFLYRTAQPGEGLALQTRQNIGDELSLIAQIELMVPIQTMVLVRPNVVGVYTAADAVLYQVRGDQFENISEAIPLENNTAQFLATPSTDVALQFDGAVTGQRCRRSDKMWTCVDDLGAVPSSLSQAGERIYIANRGVTRVWNLGADMLNLETAPASSLITVAGLPDADAAVIGAFQDPNTTFTAFGGATAPPMLQHEDFINALLFDDQQVLFASSSTTSFVLMDTWKALPVYGRPTLNGLGEVVLVSGDLETNAVTIHYQNRLRPR